MADSHKEPTPSSAAPTTKPDDVEPDMEVLYPAIAQYGTYNVRNMKPGEVKYWCTCGLSKKQPWCDGSHRGTGFKPLKWTVPPTPQTLYQLCGCKYTKDPPFCDATHVYLPLDVIKRREECKVDHATCEKLCTKCGTVPEW